MRVGVVIPCCLAWTTMAWAAPPSVELDWNAPPQCPAQAAIERQVEAFLGRPLGAETDRELRIQVVVRSSGSSGYLLVLEVVSDAGERQRRLEHDDCEKLGEATALLIAMAIDPDAVRPNAAPTGEPESKPVTTEAPTPGESEPAEQERGERIQPTRSRRLVREVSAGAHGLLGAGVLPGAGAGVGAELGLKLGSSLRLLAVASHWMDRTEPVKQAEVVLGMVGGGLRGCWVLGGRWEPALCAGPNLGVISGSGRNLEVNRDASDRWSAVGLEAQVGYGLTRFFLLQAGVEADVALERPVFEVDGYGEVHRPAPWALRARLGVVVRSGFD